MTKGVVFYPYAEYKLNKRNLAKSTIIEVLQSPDKILEGKFGRKIAQKTIGHYIIRVIFEEYQNHLLVITAYPARKGRY